MTGGKIAGNRTDNDGGGLFAPHNMLGNITIAQPAIFTGDMERNGLRVDNLLAEEQCERINPGAVSVTDLHIIGETPQGSDNFAVLAPHGFTNYDINTQGLRFWRVTYVAEQHQGQSEITAEVGLNNLPVPSNSLVSDGALLTFDANPIRFFRNWEIWTRVMEKAEESELADFELQGEYTIYHLLAATLHNDKHPCSWLF